MANHRLIGKEEGGNCYDRELLLINYEAGKHTSQNVRSIVAGEHLLLIGGCSSAVRLNRVHVVRLVSYSVGFIFVLMDRCVYLCLPSELNTCSIAPEFDEQRFRHVCVSIFDVSIPKTEKN